MHSRGHPGDDLRGRRSVTSPVPSRPGRPQPGSPAAGGGDTRPDLRRRGLSPGSTPPKTMTPDREGGPGTEPDPRVALWTEGRGRVIPGVWVAGSARGGTARASRPVGLCGVSPPPSSSLTLLASADPSPSSSFGDPAGRLGSRASSLRSSAGVGVLPARGGATRSPVPRCRAGMARIAGSGIEPVPRELGRAAASAHDSLRPSPTSSGSGSREIPTAPDLQRWWDPPRFSGSRHRGRRGRAAATPVRRRCPHRGWGSWTRWGGRSRVRRVTDLPPPRSCVGAPCHDDHRPDLRWMRRST